MGSGTPQELTNLALAAGRLRTASVLTAISGSTLRRPALMRFPISHDASGAQFAAA